MPVVFAQAAEGSAVSEGVRAFMNAPLMTIAGTPISLWTLLTVVIVVLVTLYLSRWIQAGIGQAMRMRKMGDPGTIQTVQRLAHYATLGLGLAIALQTVGINLGALFAAGAVVAVGIGFAMQNLSQNFVSGLILLGERSIKPGDVLEVEGRTVRVVEMRIRSTIARTRDDEDVIIPNSKLVESVVKNLTLLDPQLRVRADVGVVYGSDIDRVVQALERAAHSVDGRLEEHDPVVFMRAHGSSSLEFQVSVWSPDPWVAPQVQSDLTKAINRVMADEGITIAFPQVDVHFDPPLTEAVTRRLTG